MRRLASSLVLGVSLCLVGSLAASAQTSQQPAHQGQQAKKPASADKKGGWEPLETVPDTSTRTPGYVGIGQQGFSQPYTDTAVGQANQGLPSPFGFGNNITSQPTR